MAYDAKRNAAGADGADELGHEQDLRDAIAALLSSEEEGTVMEPAEEVKDRLRRGDFDRS